LTASGWSATTSGCCHHRRRCRSVTRSPDRCWLGGRGASADWRRRGRGRRGGRHRVPGHRPAGPPRRWWAHPGRSRPGGGQQPVPAGRGGTGRHRPTKEQVLADAVRAINPSAAVQAVAASVLDIDPALALFSRHGLLSVRTPRSWRMAQLYRLPVIVPLHAFSSTTNSPAGAITSRSTSRLRPRSVMISTWLQAASSLSALCGMVALMVEDFAIASVDSGFVQRAKALPARPRWTTSTPARASSRSFQWRISPRSRRSCTTVTSTRWGSGSLRRPPRPPPVKGFRPSDPRSSCTGHYSSTAGLSPAMSRSISEAPP
jgi:hypothetical protein